MHMGFCLLPLKISHLASNTLQKLVFVAVSETEKVISDYSDSEHYILGDSDIKASYDLLEDSDNSVVTNELCCHSRSKDWVKIHHFLAQKPGVNCHIPPIPRL
jgi:hypothetical protein